MKNLFDKVSAQTSKFTTQTYSTSFSLGIYFLDKKFHRPISGIYGLVRGLADDQLLDSLHNYNKAGLFQRFKTDLALAVEEGY